MVVFTGFEGQSHRKEKYTHIHYVNSDVLDTKLFYDRFHGAVVELLCITMNLLCL